MRRRICLATVTPSCGDVILVLLEADCLPVLYALHRLGAVRATQSDGEGIGSSHVLSLGQRGNLITRASRVPLRSRLPTTFWGILLQAEGLSPYQVGRFPREEHEPCQSRSRNRGSDLAGNPPDFFRHTPMGYSLSRGGLVRGHPVRMLPVDLLPPPGIA